MPDAVIVDAVRTPIGKRRGSLADVHPVDLSAVVLTALAERTGIDPELVDDVLWGCVNQAGDQASQVGRYAVLAAGWPETVPGATINRACGSSQSSFDFAAGMVMSGQYDLVVAGGVESMTRVPLGSGRDFGSLYGPLVRERYKADLTSGEFPGGDFNQGIGAERIARRWRLSRRTLDEYASRSHELAAAATDRGDFAGQLAPVPAAPATSTPAARTSWPRRPPTAATSPGSSPRCPPPPASWPTKACAAAPHRRRSPSSSPRSGRTG